MGAALVILWLEAFWRHCLRTRLQPVGHVRIGAENLRPGCSCRCAARRGRGPRLALLRGQRQWTGRGCGAKSARATGYAQFSTGLPSSARETGYRCPPAAGFIWPQQPARHNARKGCAKYHPCRTHHPHSAFRRAYWWRQDDILIVGALWPYPQRLRIC